METSQLEALIKKYNRGQCTPEEKQWLEQWYLSFEWTQQEELPQAALKEFKEEVWHNLQRTPNEGVASPEPPLIPIHNKQGNRWWYYGAAAILLLAGSIYFLTNNQPPENDLAQVKNETQVQKPILPGTSKASLTMADGSVISLDSAAVTQLKEADGTTIDKRLGTIVYNNTIEKNKKILYNTLHIPRGGEYQLVLPDGSKVWLNAASSLRFPTSFTEKERTVYLTGEAYFEIAKNQAQPFKVVLEKDMEIQVVGTHFNVMAYNDEDYIKTTLAEGKIKFKNASHTVFLNPAQQAALKKNTQQLEVKGVDIDKEIAWKNGMIEFHDDDLPYIMRQLARWYDVEVSFEGSIPGGSYNGSIARKATLPEVMQILKLAGVKYWLDNKKVVITGA